MKCKSKPQRDSTSHLLECLSSKPKNCQVLSRMRRKGNLSTAFWGLCIGVALWKTEQRFLKKLKMELLYDPAIPTPDIWPKEMKIGSQTGFSALITCVDPRKARLRGTHYGALATRDWREVGRWWSGVRTTQDEMNMFWGANIQHVDYS